MAQADSNTSTTSRRQFLTVAAAASAVSATALAAATMPTFPLVSGVDPIFAAIEAHRQAVETVAAVLLETSRQEDARRKEHFEKNPGTVYSVYDVTCPDAAADVLESETDAALQLASIVPTTTAGVAAILAYATKHRDKFGSLFPMFDDDDGVTRPFEFFAMKNCAEALANISAA